jgi:hypothetical protein
MCIHTIKQLTNNEKNILFFNFVEKIKNCSIRIGQFFTFKNGSMSISHIILVSSQKNISKKSIGSIIAQNFHQNF